MRNRSPISRSARCSAACARCKHSHRSERQPIFVAGIQKFKHFQRTCLIEGKHFENFSPALYDSSNRWNGPSSVRYGRSICFRTPKKHRARPDARLWFVRHTACSAWHARDAKPPALQSVFSACATVHSVKFTR